MIPSVVLQKKLYQELDKGIYPVVESMPSKAEELPLIKIGNIQRFPDYTKTNDNRFLMQVQIDGFSFGKSSIEIKEIEDFIFQTVMNLTLKEYKVEQVNLDLHINLKEDETLDRLVFHSIQEFGITIAKTKSEGED